VSLPISKKKLNDLILDEKNASKEYHKIAMKANSEEARVFEGMAHDERRHHKNLVKMKQC
jgi:rubrerythrin